MCDFVIVLEILVDGLPNQVLLRVQAEIFFVISKFEYLSALQWRICFIGDLVLVPDIQCQN